MKHLSLIIILVFLTGMTVFAQSADMSYYIEEYNRADATFTDRLEVLQTIQAAELTGIGEFYHDALKVLLTKLPDIATNAEAEEAEAIATIICQGLAAEQYEAAAPELWALTQHYDVVRDANDGLVMQEALLALGKVGDKAHVPHIALRLDNFNTDVTSDVETRRRVQRGVVGCINALEDLKELEGYSPVFFASVGWYDPSIRAMATNALPNISEDPGEIVISIIRNPSNDPSVKYEAWLGMLRTRAGDESIAKVAAVALEVGWTYTTSVIAAQRLLREMRISAIDAIRFVGVADESVYTYLDRSYTSSFVTNVPDYDEIRITIDTLTAVKSEEAVELLLGYLRELHARRRGGPWGNRERLVMQMVIPALGATETQSQAVRLLLTTIQRSSDYTGAEQGWAASALRQLGQ